MPESPHEAILAQERRALDLYSSGCPSGYLEVQADDVTYFDDIAIDQMRGYFTSSMPRSPNTNTRWRIGDEWRIVHAHWSLIKTETADDESGEEGSG